MRYPRGDVERDFERPRSGDAGTLLGGGALGTTEPPGTACCGSGCREIVGVCDSRGVAGSLSSVCCSSIAGKTESA